MSSYLLAQSDLAILANGIYNIVQFDRLSGESFLFPNSEKYTIQSECTRINKTLKTPYLYPLNEFNVFRALNLLNADALNARYGDPIESNLYDMPDVFPSVSRIQFYKILQSFLYQCAEGKVPETALYRTLESVKHLLASEIVCSLDEYNKARWA